MVKVGLEEAAKITKYSDSLPLWHLKLRLLQILKARVTLKQYDGHDTGIDNKVFIVGGRTCRKCKPNSNRECRAMLWKHQSLC